MKPRSKIVIRGIPSDLGANIRGANMGPPAVRIASLKEQIKSIGYQVEDWGDAPVPIRDELGDEVVATKYLDPITHICQSLAKDTYKAMSQGEFPLVIGGDHSLAIGSISGVSRFYKEQKKKFGVIWVDAHADINTHTSSESGNIHGMPLATLLGMGHPQLTDLEFAGRKLDPENVALIGIRTLDAREKDLLRASGISYFDMRTIDERGMYRVMQEVIAITCADTDGVHLSFDLDGVDPLYAPGVSTAVPGGLSFREAHLLLEMLAETKKLKSMEFVELNPYTDVGSQSAKLVVDLILSSLGKSIV